MMMKDVWATNKRMNLLDALLALELWPANGIGYAVYYTRIVPLATLCVPVVKPQWLACCGYYAVGWCIGQPTDIHAISQASCRISDLYVCGWTNGTIEIWFIYRLEPQIYAFVLNHRSAWHPIQKCRTIFTGMVWLIKGIIHLVLVLSCLAH